MLGLPTENFDDVEGIAVLADKIAREYYDLPKDNRKGRVNINVSTSYFVPKPFTPFQWSAMETVDNYLEKQRFLKGKIDEQLNRKSIRYNWHDAETSIIEGILLEAIEE